MSTTTKFTPTRVIVLYPHTRGYTYAVMDSPLEIVEMRLHEVRNVEVNDLVESLKKVVTKHVPASIVIEDSSCRFSRKGKKTKEVLTKLKRWVKRKNLPFFSYTREQIRLVFENWHARNKYEIAQVLSRNIPELEPLMYYEPTYPKREQNIEALFVTISLGVTHFYLQD